MSRLGGSLTFYMFLEQCIFYLHGFSARVLRTVYVETEEVSIAPLTFSPEKWPSAPHTFSVCVCA